MSATPIVKSSVGCGQEEPASRGDGRGADDVARSDGGVGVEAAGGKGRAGGPKEERRVRYTVGHIVRRIVGVVVVPRTGRSVASRCCG